MRPLIRLAAVVLAPATLLLPACAALAATCSVSPQDLTLGQYDPLSTSSLNAVTNIVVTCDVTTAFVITLGPGNGTYLSRKMIGGSQTLTYNLFQDSSHNIVWGDGTNGSSSLSWSAVSKAFQVYAHAPGAQVLLKPGLYTDTISVTVTY